MKSFTFPNRATLKTFTVWFAREIGTEYEIDSHDNGEQTIIIFDLTQSEAIDVDSQAQMVMSGYWERLE